MDSSRTAAPMWVRRSAAMSPVSVNGVATTRPSVNASSITAPFDGHQR
nr:hypothetical protein [Streptomyces fulvorobeus]